MRFSQHPAGFNHKKSRSGKRPSRLCLSIPLRAEEDFFSFFYSLLPGGKPPDTPAMRSKRYSQAQRARYYLFRLTAHNLPGPQSFHIFTDPGASAAGTSASVTCGIGMFISFKLGISPRTTPIVFISLPIPASVRALATVRSKKPL